MCKYNHLYFTDSIMHLSPFLLNGIVKCMATLVIIPKIIALISYMYVTNMIITHSNMVLWLEPF